MRILINNQEFYIFKNLHYREANYYYTNKGLSAKFFTQDSYNLSNNTLKILNMLKASPLAPVLTSVPEEQKATLEEQLIELQNYLDIHFKIKMDDRNRFYMTKKASRGIFCSTEKINTYYFSWTDIIQLYNIPHRYISNTILKNKYLDRKYNEINSLEKKYVYLNLQRIKNNGFTIYSEKVISLPV